MEPRWEKMKVFRERPEGSSERGGHRNQQGVHCISFILRREENKSMEGPSRDPTLQSAVKTRVEGMDLVLQEQGVWKRRQTFISRVSPADEQLLSCWSPWGATPTLPPPHPLTSSSLPRSSCISPLALVCLPASIYDSTLSAPSARLGVHQGLGDRGHTCYRHVRFELGPASVVKVQAQLPCW
jgi:hypothetical protein